MSSLIPVVNGFGATQTMAAYCLHVLEGTLKGWTWDPPFHPVDLPRDAEAAGLFVTYTTAPKRIDDHGTNLPEPSLRGCIGTFAQGNLEAGLRRYALVSAARDHRFAPITTPELPQLACSVTVLSAPRPVASWDAWEVGTHGVRLAINGPRGTGQEDEVYTATFLPDVIFDNGWSRKATILHLLRKAGYPGVPTPAVFSRCRVEVFEGAKASATYDEYALDYRDMWSFTGCAGA